MHDSRPKNLNLFTIRFPLPAIVSILHRISGFFLFLLIPFILLGLSYSLTYAGFEALQQWFGNGYVKAVLWLVFVPFCFHFVAGIRHLLSDIHLGDSLQGGRRGAWLTLFVTVFLIILAGIWLW
jgi:succinate dehydrogenase / fumarate reductase, cytochrome b subunit